MYPILEGLNIFTCPCSGIIHATPMAGERVSHVKTHCLEAWAAWGKPHAIKTDNGPAYTSRGFQAFCARLEVSHHLGLPYNPQGQGIVERANRTIKEILQKQKGGIAEHATPRERTSLALFTLNFLNLNESNTTAADRHVNSIPSLRMHVMWKDVLDNNWYGPDPVIQRSRGAVCVFPQDRTDPIWVPERLTRRVESPREEDASLSDENVEKNNDAVVADSPDACQ